MQKSSTGLPNQIYKANRRQTLHTASQSLLIFQKNVEICRRSLKGQLYHIYLFSYTNMQNFQAFRPNILLFDFSQGILSLSETNSLKAALSDI